MHLPFINASSNGERNIILFKISYARDDVISILPTESYPSLSVKLIYGLVPNNKAIL